MGGGGESRSVRNSFAATPGVLTGRMRAASRGQPNCKKTTCSAVSRDERSSDKRSPSVNTQNGPFARGRGRSVAGAHSLWSAHGQPGVDGKMRVLLSGDEREQRGLAAARKEGVAFADIAASMAREFGGAVGRSQEPPRTSGAIPGECLEQTAHRAYLTRKRGTLRRVGLRCRFSSSTPNENKTSRKHAPRSDC